jgi:hypothetical protein
MTWVAIFTACGWTIKARFGNTGGYPLDPPGLTVAKDKIVEFFFDEETGEPSSSVSTWTATAKRSSITSIPWQRPIRPGQPYIDVTAMASMKAVKLSRYQWQRVWALRSLIDSNATRLDAEEPTPTATATPI